jgi:hypothetical protein
MTRSLQDHSNAVAEQWFRNTAGLSGELSVGDLVAVGEAALVCERAGWAPLRGGITEARIDEHGTHPLPSSLSPPGAPAQPGG